MKKKLIFRFDDIHPLMNKDAFEFILYLSKICPKSIMLCVIPDNKDKSLIKSNSPIPEYWEKLVLIESKGVTIGLHGLEHKLKLCKTSSYSSIICISKGRSKTITDSYKDIFHIFNIFFNRESKTFISCCLISKRILYKSY